MRKIDKLKKIVSDMRADADFFAAHNAHAAANAINSWADQLNVFIMLRGGKASKWHSGDEHPDTERDVYIQLGNGKYAIGRYDGKWGVYGFIDDVLRGNAVVMRWRELPKYKE